MVFQRLGKQADCGRRHEDLGHHRRGDFSGGSPAVSGLTNAKWQSINITTAGGSFLLMVNGADKMRIYNGTTWDSDGGGTYTVTGSTRLRPRISTCSKPRLVLPNPNPESLVSAHQLHCRRGALVRLLRDCQAWRIPDDHADMDDGRRLRHGRYGRLADLEQGKSLFIVEPTPHPPHMVTGRGFEIGAPIGRRAGISNGGDIVVMTQDGLVPLGQSHPVIPT